MDHDPRGCEVEDCSECGELCADCFEPLADHCEHCGECSCEYDECLDSEDDDV